MKTKSVTIAVLVPARGERPRREYHADIVYQLGYIREPPEYCPAEWVEVEIIDLPDSLTAEDAQFAVQALLDHGGGVPARARWDRDVIQALRHKHIEFVPGKPEKENRR